MSKRAKQQTPGKQPAPAKQSPPASQAPPAKQPNSIVADSEVLYIYKDKRLAATVGTERIECVESATQTKPKTRERPRIGVPIPKLPSITPRHKPKRRRIKIMDWKKYHRLNTIYAFIDELERDYPAICTVSVIGKSVEGRKIKMIKISNTNANNKAVWLDAAIHSREWITTAVVTYLADFLVRNFKILPFSLTNKDWHIVPVLNPDGYEYTHTHDRLWRKNRAWYGGECVGVDLNRNFSYGWGLKGEQGSSEDPNSVFYRGPEPFSEPESIAVRDAILGSSTPFKVFLSFHSYFEVIIFPWGCRGDNPPDYMNLLEGGAVMARAIFNTTGKTYRVGTTKDLTYNACGTSTDWSYSIAKIPYSYMVELRSRKHKFRLPKDQILDTCNEILNGVKSLMDYVDTH